MVEKKSVKFILRLFLFIFFLFVVVKACTYHPLESEQSSSNQSPEQIKPIKISASELFNAYENNEVAADNNFEDKVVIISGKVDEIGKDIMDNPYITFYRGEYAFSHVQCMFDDENELMHLSRLDPIRVKGVVSGKVAGSVLVRHCTTVFDEETK
jgi:hypothetical protein